MLPEGGWLCVYAVKICSSGTSLVVPWLRLRVSVVKTRVSSAGDVGLIPGQGTKISYAKGCGQNRPPPPPPWFYLGKPLISAHLSFPFTPCLGAQQTLGSILPDQEVLETQEEPTGRRCV